MLKKFIVPGLFFFIFSVFPLNAANISFLVIETGLPRGSRTNQYSTMWENGLLDVFFDSGYIVTNAPIMRLYETPGDNFPYEAERDFRGAGDGGMDYFIIAIINYPSPRGAANPRPLTVTLRLFNTSSEEMIHEQIITNMTGRNTRDEFNNIRRAVSEFAAVLP